MPGQTSCPIKWLREDYVQDGRNRTFTAVAPIENMEAPAYAGLHSLRDYKFKSFSQSFECLVQRIDFCCLAQIHHAIHLGR